MRKSLKLFREETSMYRRYFFIISAALAVLLINTLSASAQIERLRGQVMLKQADGNMVPVEKAVVEVFRTDRGGNKSTETDKKGNFTLPLDVAGEYVLAISAPNATPQMMRAKVREELYKITLEPGNGRRLTKDEVMGALNGTPIPSKGGGSGATSTQTTTTPTATAPAESAEDKAKRADIEKKNEDIKVKNAKIEQSNATVLRTFKAGKEARLAKRYDEAITLFTEGLAADPEQAALWTEKSIALRLRGVDRYNAAARTKDEAGLEAAKKDLRDAAEAASKAVELAKSEPAVTDPRELAAQNARKLVGLENRAESMRLFVKYVDKTKGEEGFTAYQEYIAAETKDPEKKKAQVSAAQLLYDSDQYPRAAEEFQKILASDPENVEAMLGAGLALFASGDKAKFQQAANFLQQFVDKAPADHPLRQSAKESLDYLTTQENVKPQKATGRRRG
jgi:tetratricopeptide (TPR) repeat protein